MHFNIKRYIYGVSKRRTWFVLILLFPLIYLIIKAMAPDMFTVSQQITIPKDAPVALASSPTGYGKAHEIADNPSGFFQNHFAMRAMYNQLNAGAGDFRTDPQFRRIALAAKESMSLKMTGENVMQISYYGSDEEFGKDIVQLYSQRLVHKGIEGLSRSRTQPGKSIIPQISGDVSIKAHHTLWRSNRFRPIVQIAILSVLIVLVLLGVIEWSDPSLKSERQVARYVGLPILGSMPDLNKVYSAIGNAGGN